MPTSTEELAVLVLQATAILAAPVLVVRGLIRLLRPASPSVQRIAWLLVLVQGAVLVRFSVHVPWYESELAMAPATKPSMPDGTAPLSNVSAPIPDRAMEPPRALPAPVAASEPRLSGG